jgi:hypothetical protein
MKNLNVLFVLLIVSLQLSGQGKGILFKRVDEPKEKALSLLIPKGWIVDGGAIRFLDERIAGANNMVDCKFDFSVKKEASGSVMIRWLPEILCIDQSKAWGNPEGAIFNNSLVRKKRTPERFIFEVAVPYAHPNATDVKMVSGKFLPGIASRYQSSVDPAIALVTNMSYQAYLAEYTYSENSVRYQERMTCVIEDYGMNGGGLWKNRETMLIRAPEGQLANWEPVLNVIQNSGKWSIPWVTGEVNGQRKRAGQVLATQQEIEAMDKAITDNRRNTYSEINKDMYHTLTGQDEFKNPFTGQTEVDTDSWQRRWVDASGNVIYSNDTNYDPNNDVNLNVSGFKLSRKGN